MVRFAAGLCLLLAACFNPTFNNPTCGPNGECPSGTTCMNGVCVGGGGDDDGDGGGGDIDTPDPDLDATDAPPTDAAVVSAIFLPPAASIPGTADWTITTIGMIDTTTLTTMPALPMGVTLTTSMQVDAAAPEVAVLHVNRFQLGGGVQLNVRGSRPLVIVAGSDVVIDGILNVGSTITTPGAGGLNPGTGAGAGQPGGSQGIFNDDAGGGGAGFGSPGGRGGDALQTQGGSGGAPVGISPPMQLQGGSGGGSGGFGGGCPQPVGGAGGGAILVASATRISIAGGINAGGGGGNGGANCGNAPGGGGGGAGGQIDLQAPSYPSIVVGMVQLAANGGGGGGGGQSAQYGVDGQLSNFPAQGGAPGSNGGQGGDGAASTNGALSGVNGSQDAGGGGGGVGRITIRYQGAQPMFSTSPPATFVTY
jgi:hypothetical protein